VSEQRPQGSDPRRDPNLIRVFDKSGREMFIPKATWRTNVLPGMVRSNWDSADRLYQTIVTALNDGFAADTVDAANRLYAIDGNQSRATTVLGIVMMQTNRLDEAERLYNSYLAKHGNDAVVLTNLAKVHAQRGDQTTAERILWQALECDPNLDNAVLWYFVAAREKGGEDGETAALRKLAALPSSWRAHLWLARKALRDGRPDDALATYTECLAAFTGPAPVDFLMQASGDLGNAGFIKMIVQLFGSAFVPEVHGLLVGNNLMKAHVELSNFDEAARVLQRLKSIQRPDWQETLRFWENEIATKQAGARARRSN
jgi:Flp pilus assembly protein TadD